MNDHTKQSHKSVLAKEFQIQKTRRKKKIRRSSKNKKIIIIMPVLYEVRKSV